MAVKNAVSVVKAAFQLKIPIFKINAAVLKNKPCSNACVTVIGACFMGSTGKYCKQLNGK